MRKVIVLGSLVLTATLCLPSNIHATPTIFNDLVYSDNRPADDIFGISGLRVQLTLAATDPGGSGALTGAGAGTTATSSNPGFPLSQPVPVPVNSFFSLLGVEFTANLPLSGGAADFSKFTGTYGFTVTNTMAQTASDTSHNFDKPEVIPLPTGLKTSNNSTTPVFSFTDPSPTPGIAGLARRYDFFIHDGVTNAAIFEFGAATGQLSLTPSFTVPTGLLVPGHPYFFAAASVDFDTTEPSSSINITWEGRSREYLAFTPTPVPEPTSLLLVGSALTGLTAVAWRRRHRM